MRYNKIRKMDISNGPGVRVSIFEQGCAFNCPNCFNPETHDFKGGQEFDQEAMNKILGLCDSENIKGLSILGGEPLHPNNIEGTTELAKAFKEKFPNKNLWIWTGYKFDDDMKQKELFKYADVLVDGQYIDKLRDPRLHWKGSSNQRVIDIQQTLKNDEITIIE